MRSRAKNVTTVPSLSVPIVTAVWWITAKFASQRQAPVAAFPGHWAPNDLVIYHGTRFPEGYRGGAFIAFHGSWNRAPDAQGGYNVVFQPLADGKASGPFMVFADGFAGAYKDPGRAAFRPTGFVPPAVSGTPD
jgi:glucose/arabinose dehydrogenase